MPRFASRLAAAALAVVSPAFADDKPVTKPAVAATAPADWSNYTKVSEVAGEVVSADKDGFTLRVTWYTTSSSGGGRGGRGGNSGLNNYRSLMNGQMPHRRAGGTRPPKVTEHHEDYPLTFADGGLVRWHKLADVPGAKKGGFVPPDDQARLKLPAGTPGWAADRADLKPGHVVEVTLVRPKDVPAAKVTPADLKVKYAVIHREDPDAPPPDKKK